MKNKKFDTIKETRAIREQNYEETKNFSREELLERYRTRGKAALEKLKKSSGISN